MNHIDDETAKVVSNIIKDGIEDINLLSCNSTKQAIATIAEKISKLINPVNIFIFLKSGQTYYLIRIETNYIYS